MNYGMIDIGLCAEVVSKTYMEQVVPLGIIVGMLGVSIAILVFLFMYQAQDIKLMKGFLHREKLLQKYNDWLKERKLE